MIEARKHRKSYSAEEKAKFVLYCLSAKRNVAKACRERQTAGSLYYKWRKKFICGGTAALQRDLMPAPKGPEKDSNIDNTILLSSILIVRYSECLRANYPLNSHLPAAAKLEIIDMVENAAIVKDAALKLVGIPRTSYYRWLKLFRETGNVRRKQKPFNQTRLSDREDLKQQLFKVLHAPPSDYGFNRTTWRFNDLQQALKQSGIRIGRHTMRKIVRSAGYRWRKARLVLTSQDPEYKQKLKRIQSILSNLEPNELFFSIDEFGPFAVKHRQGKKLVAPGETFVVPQWQKSKGCIILTAALELSSNQVTHFYSKKKNTNEMIKLMDLLVRKYSERKRIYLSWDAASWHISKKLHEHIETHNSSIFSGNGPQVQTAPLPAGAQFLNVIESIFSGMARAIIHNSDYSSVDEAKAAIDRYFLERNASFARNPHRAGNKIWGNEREPAEFSCANNCKDPHYR